MKFIWFSLKRFLCDLQRRISAKTGMQYEAEITTAFGRQNFRHLLLKEQVSIGAGTASSAVSTTSPEKLAFSDDIAYYSRIRFALP